MTYRDDLQNELIEKGIKCRKNDLSVLLEKGFYEINDLITFLRMDGEYEIKKFNKTMEGFAHKIGKTRQAIRLGVISKKFLILKKGHYDKDKLISYIEGIN